ncbi:MAG TPA: hypothetical protein VKX28_03065 [Xanthobacteraceae bacterium]|jgi:hypothetical protein|nr:hypothetical protein [Xanthobacteraceae bacterium]
MKKLTTMLAVAVIAAAPTVALAKRVHHHHHQPKVEPVQYSSNMAHLLHDLVTGN